MYGPSSLIKAGRLSRIYQRDKSVQRGKIPSSKGPLGPGDPHDAPGWGALAGLFRCDWDAETWDLNGLPVRSSIKGKLCTTVVLVGFSEEGLCTKLLTGPNTLTVLYSSQLSALGTGWGLGELSVLEDHYIHPGRGCLMVSSPVKLTGLQHPFMVLRWGWANRALTHKAGFLFGQLPHVFWTIS